MADYKFTQTGAQIQALLDRVANFGIYRHEIQFSTSTSNQSKIVIISPRSTSYTIEDLIDNVTNVPELSKIMQIYVYSDGVGAPECQPAIYVNFYGSSGGTSGLNYAVCALGSSIVSYTMTTFVSDTVTRLF